MATLSNRAITIYNRKTSIRLAPAEWDALDYICKKENISRKNLFELIEFNHDKKIGLTPSVRLFMIIYYKSMLTELEHTRQQYIDSEEFYNPIFEAIKKIA